MGSSSKRARRRQKAQESLERRTSHSKQVKDNKMDSDTEEGEDQEILFHPKTQESVHVMTPPSPNRVLEVPDCAIVDVTSMVKNCGVPRYSANTTGLPTTAQGQLGERQGYGGPHCHGERIWIIPSSHTTIWSADSKNANGCPGRGWKFACRGYWHYLGRQ